MKFSLGEINIFVSDLERSLAFYCDVLGFENLGEDRGAVHLKGAGHAFLLLPFASADASPPKYGARPSVSFDLEVSDIEKAYAYFRDAKVAFERNLEPGGDHFFVRDPDGTVIEIVQP